MVVSIIAFIILLLFLVTIHEFGHFILARKSGVTVHEFAVWMWPKVRSFGKDKKWTEFTLRALPIWWFVRIKWESPDEAGVFEAKDSFLNASFLQKIAILLGWIVMNIIGAWIIFTIGFSVWVKPIQLLPDNVLKWESRSYLMPTVSFLKESGFLSGDVKPEEAEVEYIAPDGLAEQIGLQKWDTILSVQWVSVNTKNLPETLKEYIGKEFLLVVERQWDKKSLPVTCPEDACFLGIKVWWKVSYELLPIKFSLPKAMIVALEEMREQSRLTFNGLWNIVKQLWTSKRWETVNKLSWPIGAAKIWQWILETGGWVMFLIFWWMLSLGLAIFNLLPIPALDGGRLLWVIIQKLFRLKPEKYYTIEWWINTVFFFALLILWFYIMAHDLVKAWWVKIPFIG
jgi:regulator of sigma E protease